MLTTLTFEFLGWSLQQNGKVFLKSRNLVTTLAWWLTCCESLVSRKSSELPCDMQWTGYIWGYVSYILGWWVAEFSNYLASHFKELHVQSKWSLPIWRIHTCLNFHSHDPLKLLTNKIAWIHWSMDLGPLSKVGLMLGVANYAIFFTTLELSVKSPSVSPPISSAFASYPLFQSYLWSKEILLNLGMKWWNSAFNTQG
jgi:hypothetical protein